MTSATDCTRSITPADAPQLQSILDELTDGAVLCLAAGTYESGNLTMRHAVSLRGTGATPEAVVIDGGNRGPVLQLWADGGELTISGLTIRGGVAQPSVAVGGVYAHGTARVTFDRVVFTGNACDSAGGQALYTDAGRLVLERCRIEGNFGDRSATVVVESIGTLTLRESSVTTSEGKRAFAVRDAAQLVIERSSVSAGAATVLEIGGNPTQSPTATITGSQLTGARAVANGPIAGKVRISGSVVSGTISGPFEDAGGNTIAK